MYLHGRHLDWKVLVLVHNKRTLRKYEKILGDLSFAKRLPNKVRRRCAPVQQLQKPKIRNNLSDLDGRSDRIRTYDPLVPNQMRYQTALRSEVAILAGPPFRA